MKEKLESLLKNAYSPYYKFPVAAIVVMKDEKEFGGVNVENANGTSICAERNAIASAVAAGYKKNDFDKIYIMLSSGEFGTPCFACRQVIQEFMDLDCSVISVNKNGDEKEYSVKELCPYPFSQEDLR
ncbi:MAG: cytidine deaminase [Bacilli bacterium]|nr:cytidine deaminase [Bacilli bacterium]